MIFKLHIPKLASFAVMLLLILSCEEKSGQITEAQLPWLIGTGILFVIVFALAIALRIREADERAKLMLEYAPLASCMFNKDLKIFDCNQEVVKMFGIPDKEFFLNRFFELFPEYQSDGALSSDEAIKNIRIAFEKGYHRFELMHIKPNGDPLPTEITLVRVKYRDKYVLTSYMRDLTEQKAAEQLTKLVTEKNSTLTAILDSNPDLIFCKDLNSRFTECNKATEKHFNCLKADILGKNDTEAFGLPLELATQYMAMNMNIFNEKQLVTVEEIIPSFDGKQSLFETKKAPIIQNGEAVGLVIMARDITKSKEMAKQQIESEAANRAKSSFLATMSHEIRTPMNAILGITEIQLQNGTLPSETKNALNIIYNSGYTLLGIINDLLDLSKIEAGKLELMNERYEMASTINDTINLNTARIGSKPIEFRLQVSEDLPCELIGDELRIKQILNNLLSNAFKYTDNGEVTLSFSSETIEEKVVLAITVRDTGQGMNDEQVQSLFDAYSRFNMKANRFVEGTGLGMNIVQNLVQKMGGNISVNSEPGKGTEVIVHLTQGYANSAKLGSEAAKKLMGFHLPSISKMKKAQIVREHMPYGKVLVVDDMETNLYVAKGFLLPYGLAIDTALSGKEAIEKIKHGKSYDIVFMDHMMPVMDGIEAVRAIRANGYARPIIALTANAVTGQAEIFLANGFDGFISKPIDIRELNASLNKYVRGKRLTEVTEAQQLNPELAKIFTRDAEKAIAVLQEYETNNSYQSDDLKMYTINVHALKSVLANIYEIKLSSFAKDLEQAGREQNIAFISEQTPTFLGELRTLVNKLKSAAVENNAVEISDEDVAYFHEMLQIIKDACTTYDIDAAKAVLKGLKQRPWSGEYSEVLDSVSEHLLHSDFDEAGSVITIFSA